MKQKFDFNEIISILKASSIISKIEIKKVDEIKERGIYKIRCNLTPSKYKLDVRFIKTEQNILYSYQLFCDKPIIRWDNAPHYPGIKTFPHHFHDMDGCINDSKLQGNVIEDLQEVITMIQKVLSTKT